MMDDRPDLGARREVDPLGYPASPATGTNSSYAPAIVLIALLLIGGFFLITYSGDNQQTASNAPAVERSAPAPTPAPPATPPAKQQ